MPRWKTASVASIAGNRRRPSGVARRPPPPQYRCSPRRATTGAPWPAWKCVLCAECVSHPGTPTPRRATTAVAQYYLTHTPPHHARFRDVLSRPSGWAGRRDASAVHRPRQHSRPALSALAAASRKRDDLVAAQGETWMGEGAAQGEGSRRGAPERARAPAAIHPAPT